MYSCKVVLNIYYLRFTLRSVENYSAGIQSNWFQKKCTYKVQLMQHLNGTSKGFKLASHSHSHSPYRVLPAQLGAIYGSVS